MTKKSSLPLVYKGSVKNIRLMREPRKRSPGRYVFEFTDAYSVFDYGKMPDTIRGKGAAIAMMTGFLLEELGRPVSWKRLFRRSAVWENVGGAEIRNLLRKSPAGREVQATGLRTHYVGMLDASGRCRAFSDLTAPSNRMVVTAVPVVAPKPLTLDGRVLWDYSELHPGLPMFLVPLENIFRFGVPQGSSLLRRLKRNPAYASEIGLSRVPREGEWLPRPVLEFSSKLEPMDRILGLETALNISGLDRDGFRSVRDLSLLVAVFLYDVFQTCGMDLWDGKFEFVKVNEDLLLADSITPDELRITCHGVQLSKEPLRQYYRRNDPAFLEAVRTVKEDGALKAPGAAIRRRLGRGPARLDPRFRSIAESMYRSLARRITGSSLLGEGLDLDEVVASLQDYAG